MPGHPNMKVLEQLARLVGNGVGSSMLDRQLGWRRVRAATIASYPLMGTCISNMFGLQGSWSHYSTEVSSNYDPRNKTQAKVNNIELMMIQFTGKKCTAGLHSDEDAQPTKFHSCTFKPSPFSYDYAVLLLTFTHVILRRITFGM